MQCWGYNVSMIARLEGIIKMKGERFLVLDVNGYKKRRYDSLRTLAQHIAEQVSVSQRSFALEPMPAYERRIVHLALAEHHARQGIARRLLNCVSGFEERPGLGRAVLSPRAG